MAYEFKSELTVANAKKYKDEWSKEVIPTEYEEKFNEILNYILLELGKKKDTNIFKFAWDLQNNKEWINMSLLVKSYSRYHPYRNKIPNLSILDVLKLCKLFERLWMALNSLLVQRDGEKKAYETIDKIIKINGENIGREAINKGETKANADD